MVVARTPFEEALARGQPRERCLVYFRRDDMRHVCHLDDETMAPIRAAWARGDR